MATSETPTSSAGSGSTESTQLSTSTPARKIGRPSKIDDLIIREEKRENGEVIQHALKVSDAILETVKIGNYMETAAEYAGIGARTVFRWLEFGDPDRAEYADNPEYEVYRQFRRDLARARAESQTHDIAYITEAIRNGDWQAAAWRLERTDPAHYGRRERLVLQQETTVAIALDVIELLKQALERNIPDVELRNRILKDVIEVGLAGSPSENGAERAS